MNEIELLKRFREEVPEPDEHTLRAARALLMERIAAPPAPMTHPDHRPRPRMALGLAAATAAVVAVAVILSVLLPRGGTNAAAAELRRFGAVAAKQQAQSLGPRQYFYLREAGRERITVVTMDQGTYSALTPVVYEYWLGQDGSGRLVSTPGRLLWPGPRDKLRWEAEGPTQLFGPHDQRYGPGELAGSDYPGTAFATLPEGYEFHTLPRDPETLYEVIKAAAAARESADAGKEIEPTPVSAFALYIQLLRTPLTPPEVRAALFESMAYIPGITVVPEKTVVGIGTGAAVFHDTSWGDVRVRVQFLVDPTTAEVLGEQLILLDRADWIDADPPFVMDWMAYARPEVVDAITERP